MNYLDYFIPKYKSPSSPITYIEGTNLPSTGDKEKDEKLKQRALLTTGALEINGPEKWYVDLVATDGLFKGVGLLGKGLWKGATFVAPKTTGTISTGVKTAGNAVKSGISKVVDKTTSLLKRTPSGKVVEEPFTYTANSFKYTSKHDPVSAFTETSPEVSDLLVQEQKNKLVKYFNSEEYWSRLKKAGFSDQAAKERIEALTSNPERFIIKQGTSPNGASAVTEINPFNLPGEHSITIDLSKIKSKQDLDAVLFEELSHASELNGQTWDRTVDLINQYYGSVEKFKAARPDLYKKITEGVSKELNSRLHNNIVVPFNESLGLTSDLNGTMQKFYKDLSPEERVRFDEIWKKLSVGQRQQKAAQIAEYYMLPEEQRARALSTVIEAIDKYGYYPGASRIGQLQNPLSTEFQSAYKNSGNYLDNFISFGVPIAIGGTVYGTQSR